MLRRLVHKADFERLLTTAARCRSAHFAVYHVAGLPQTGSSKQNQRAPADLSTETGQTRDTSVDDLNADRWLGTVLPKRWARRAVTRNLLRRQIRSAVESHLRQLPPGMWLVRLRAPFRREDYPSAASQALRAAARSELDGLLCSVAR
jgi:ribonuclease P protein component